MKNLMRIVLFIFVLSFQFPLFAASSRSSIDANEALDRLMKGNARFVELKTEHPNLNAERRTLVKGGQNPFAIIVSCSDSRVPPELIFDQGLGDLFVYRVAGNVIDDLALGTIEYGVAQLGANLIFVMGHEKCGAVEATLKGKPLPGHIPTVANKIKPHVEKLSCKKLDALDCGIFQNVEAVVEQLKNSPPILAERVKNGSLKIVGGIYDLESGAVVPVK